MPFSKIAILGASGSLGPHILAALLETFPVSANTILTREGSNSPLTYPAGLRLISLPSYSNKDALKGVLQGHDILISALPAAVALQFEPTIVQAAIEAGVHRFMPSEYTLDVTQSTVRALVAGSGAPPLIKGRVDWADRLVWLRSLSREGLSTRPS
jgi:saccharopine dehydrogenase-like NADP-dependent oxidoreductase